MRSNWLSSHRSSFRCLTFEMWAPILRWTPAHRVHTNIPILYEAHSGSVKQPTKVSTLCFPWSHNDKHSTGLINFLKIHFLTTACHVQFCNVHDQCLLSSVAHKRFAFLTMSIMDCQHLRVHVISQVSINIYRGADKSLARPWTETSYSNQDLQHYTKTYGVQTTGIYSCCFLTY